MPRRSAFTGVRGSDLLCKFHRADRTISSATSHVLFHDNSTAKLVHAMGGQITVDSEEGKWSSFTVDFPFQEKSADVAAISRKMNGTSVLLVHDVEEDIFYLQQMLQHYDVDFVTFRTMDGMEAAISDRDFLKHERSYVCLANEGLFAEDVFSLLSELRSSVLFTFGPRFSVDETSGHFRCIRQAIPSKLLRSMVAAVEEKNQEAPPRRRSQSSASLKNLGMNPNANLRVLVAEVGCRSEIHRPAACT